MPDAVQSEISHFNSALLSENARRYAASSFRPGTRRQYATALKQWLQWRGLIDLEPADTIDVANYLAELASAGKSISTLRTAIAAIRAGHTAKSWLFDTTAPPISLVMRGIANAHYQLPRQAEPLRGSVLSDILTTLAEGRPSLRDRRDAAVLALGYAFALRRAELAGLDFERLGHGERGGTGVLRLTLTTIEVMFAISKTSRGMPEVVSVPRDELTLAATAIEAWLGAADIKPGQPVFQRITKSSKIRGRLSGQTVAAIVKTRVAEHGRMRHGTENCFAEFDAARFSGHSLRVGFCVSAAEAGADIRSIASVTRHRSMVMPARYSQRADQLRTSPHRLVGVGLKSLEVNE
ncbi:tyrosine-type recombinase/integrase [Hyphomicrobium facile]|uniref:Site-specific recombinase XerD n=1 Tax=Hyphomicrobium facile TaxID=51670 RepID=A0A1I7NE25_9HYPH|nr:tyrosine-type recombinase/integrase [Hyphomicrobium facile]SFV32891.1 Site-specific recombinase XerD [Hyphomicrobium facile]